MKEKLITTFGWFGAVLYYFILMTIVIMPFLMIDLNFWIECILMVVYFLLPITTLIFWIWGLVCTIMGPQDILAIIYYILFAVLALPYIVLTLISLFTPHK